MPKCCSKCYMFSDCEDRNECCLECDYFSNGKCFYAEEEEELREEFEE